MAESLKGWKRRSWKRWIAAAVVLACVAVTGRALKPNSAEAVLIQKAQALEARGRPDMAAQVWQQILLADPNNSEALEGVARSFRLTGNTDASNKAIDRLRRIDPNDPNIRKLENLHSNRAIDERLATAGSLAKAGNPVAAMKIYREYYGDHPPDGDIGLAYYDTLYATPGGRDEAIAGMRAMAARNPADPRFEVELGKMLTYEPRTRSEGIHLLQQHLDVDDASVALRQALLWDAANPLSAAELREYLKNNPQDRELAEKLRENEGKLEQMNSGIARTPAERSAFAALDAHRYKEAAARFQTILQQNPNNPRADVGMGYLRMQQSDFGAALSYFTHATELGYRSKAVSNALTISRFWYTLSQAADAAKANEDDVAMEHYRAALAMRPHSPEALSGLAGLYLKERNYPAAIGTYQTLLRMHSASTDNWRGLFLAEAQSGQSSAAMATMRRFSPTVMSALHRDPVFLQALAGIYQRQGQTALAQATLRQALSQPIPADDAKLKIGLQLQYAGMLVGAREYSQAMGVYQQILNEDPNILPAWMGLTAAYHQMGQDAAAIQLVERMQPTTYDAALSDTDFLSLLASIYQQANQLEIAQSLLERSVRIQTKENQPPTPMLMTQLAGIDMLRGNTQQAYGLYRQVLTAHPDNLDAWEGLIGTLQSTGHTSEALQQIQLIPPAVRARLEQSVQFVQTEASLYSAAGDTALAAAYFNRVRGYYQAAHEPLPAEVEIQNAYLLFNAKNDRALYPALMQLGSRSDLTIAQRKTVQGLWANWAARRATADVARGDTRAATELLDATAQAFPNNPDVLRTVAGGYVNAGHAREALSLFRRIGMQNATAADYQSAIGAALAANDRNQAEAWLRDALSLYPRSAAILGTAARFEQARGDYARAADYWHASLQALPPVTPTDTLAHELVHPEDNTKVWKATTPRQLATLLNPDDRPFQNTIQLPPLPSYGHDPYEGSAPVTLPSVGSAGQGSTVTQTQPNNPIASALPLNDGWSQSPVSANAGRKVAPALPMMAERPQDATDAADTVVAEPAPESSLTATRKTRRSRAHGSGYQGQMHLPTGGQTVMSTDGAVPQQETDTPAAAPETPPQTLETSPMVSEPQALVDRPAVQDGSSSTHTNLGMNSENGLRISAQPMGALAARTQAMLADETDGQLTEGMYLPGGDGWKQSGESVANAQNPDGSTLAYRTAQYTPSAQDAAAAAYSAKVNQQQPSKQGQATPARRRRRRRGASAVPAQQQQQPTPAAPEQQPPVPTAMPPIEEPQQTYTEPQGLTDEQLQERNLPPLRGSWVKVRHAPRVLSPREEAEDQLRAIEGSYSGWLGGAGILDYRSGQPGFDFMTALESPFELSASLGQTGRFTVIGTPVFLDSGQATGNTVVPLSTLSGTPVGLQPEPLGTLLATNTTVPNQQNAVGMGAEAQLAFSTFAIAAGTTPYGFPVSNLLGRLYWRPRNGPFSINLARDSVRDSQISWAGMRDPGTITQIFPGNIWGGVVANQGTLQYAHGDLSSGFYVGLGGQYITGHHVLTNHRVDGSLGAYWRVKQYPEYGTLDVGANFFAMSYANNELAYTYGQGGYFSPQTYFLANIPVTWTGHYLTRWHYSILGSLGIQAFNNNTAPLFPLDKALEVGTTVTVGGNAVGNLAIPALTSVGPNYDLVGQTAYQISDHWFAGGFLSANNSRNYASVIAGFSVHYMFRSQPSTVTTPTGLFQYDDQHALRPLLVP